MRAATQKNVGGRPSSQTEGLDNIRLNDYYQGVTRRASSQPCWTHERTARTRAQVDAALAMVRAVAEFDREVAELLKTADLTLAQYNVLRILRGAGPAGLTCGEIGGRLVRHDPDVTRLNDRLIRRGLIESSRSAADRRVVITRITDKGLQVLAELDEPADALHERQMGHMTTRQLADLAALADATRRR
jgi:DNA-binding MarR family transcriptional regulator